MDPNDESPLLPARLQSLAPARTPAPTSPGPVKQRSSDTVFWIVALLLELAVVLGVCGIGLSVLSGSAGARWLTTLVSSQFGVSMPPEDVNAAGDASTHPADLVLATGTSTRAVISIPPSGPAPSRTPARPISNTGMSTAAPTAEPASLATPTSTPSAVRAPTGKASPVVKTATPSRTPSRTRTETAAPLPRQP